MKTGAAVFSLFCGTSMLIVWGILLVSKNFNELQSKPFGAIFLLVAEFLTAASLLLGGIGLLTHQRWGLRADQTALGMLLYCTVYSTGVFGQAGNVPAAGFFAVVAILAAVLSLSYIFNIKKGDVP